ncbi:MAG: hypothetical protein AAF514_10585 [Verrucomicrobiota bacterium]
MEGFDTRRPRVVIAEGHRLYREGLVALLREAENCVLVGIAKDVTSLAACVDAGTPDILIADDELAAEEGFAAVAGNFPTIILEHHPIPPGRTYSVVPASKLRKTAAFEDLVLEIAKIAGSIRNAKPQNNV